MNRERLERLRGLLIDDAANEKGVTFNLQTWTAKWDHEAETSKNGVPFETLEMNCGTSACAMGLAMLDPVFQSEGLQHRLDVSFRPMIVPFYMGYSEYEAGAKFFEITGDAAEWLFGPWNYPQDKRRGAEAEVLVAERIQKLLDGVQLHKDRHLGYVTEKTGIWEK